MRIDRLSDLRLLAAVWLCLSACVVAEASVTLVDDGEARAVVVLPPEPAEAEREAADELVEHVALITGVTLEVRHAGDEPGEALTPIRLGGAADETLEALIRERGDDPWGFALVVDDQAVNVRGLSPEGTRTGTYELLEQLGVRWFMPGDIGRVVPEGSTIALEAQRTVQVPSYEYRRASSPRHAHAHHWGQRMRMPGEGGRYGAHGIRPLRGSAAARYFEENPRLFSKIDGERQRRQLCLTYSTDNLDENRTLELVAEHYLEHLRENPDTEVLHMGPNDGGGFCECEHCRALDPPDHVTTPLATPAPSRTDRYVWFFNQLHERLSTAFPEVRIGFYAYGALQLPPHEVEPRDNMAISVAPIHTCRIHGPNNPVCPESSYPLWLYEAWRPYVGDYIADRGYLFNLADPGMPFSMVHRLREEIPAFHELGVRRWNADPSSAWAAHNPSAYISARLLWDHTADVDALLEEFYSHFYGPAAEPMAAYHTLMDETIRDADHHTGSLWDIPEIYPAPVREQARNHLEDAASRAADGEDDAYAIRVEITTRALDFLDAYCELRERRGAFDFAGEFAAMQRAREARDALVEEYEYPMLHPRHADRLFARFIERPTQMIYESVSDGESQIVAKLDHQWKFQQDPERWGQYIGLHKPESEGGNWQTIRTDTTWSNQGLRYYFGQAWYRQSVHIPADAEGQTVHIWFAGVDNTAEVWVNGEFVGANHDGAAFDLDAYGSAFRPFQFDASDAIHFGDENIVTVRTYRPGTNELGTGGLVGPAMFHMLPDDHDNTNDQ